MSQQPAPEQQILQIVSNHWQAHCLGVAAERELADHLADGALTIDALAARTGTHAPSLFRVLRALEGTGIFARTSAGDWINTPASECLRRDRPGSNWAWVRITLCPGALVYEGWRGLPLAVANGRTGFEQVKGAGAWTYLQGDPDAYSTFNLAMRDLAATTGPAVARAFAWDRFGTVADIGGGIGSQLTAIVDTYPGVRGLLFDRPEVVAEAPADARIERVGGDFFGAIPVDADAYLLRWILHDWTDAQCTALLANIRAACRPEARLMIVESVLPESTQDDPGKWMDVNMLVMAGGRERTRAEFECLLGGAGFAVEEVVATASPLSIIVARPACSCAPTPSTKRRQP